MPCRRQVHLAREGERQGGVEARIHVDQLWAVGRDQEVELSEPEVSDAGEEFDRPVNKVVIGGHARDHGCGPGLSRPRPLSNLGEAAHRSPLAIDDERQH